MLVINHPDYSPEYATEIYRHLREKEDAVQTARVRLRQVITERQRATLVDWMVEVHCHIRHLTTFPNVFYLSVRYLDKYLSRRRVEEEKLQLIGVTAMVLACKLEATEGRQVSWVDTFLDFCNGRYSKDQLLSLEQDMWRTLHYKLNLPTAFSFLPMFARALNVRQEIFCLAQYICELCLVEANSESYKHSIVAASALLLAMKMKQEGDWTWEMENYSGYRRADLIPCVKELNRLNRLSALPPRNELKAVREKYSLPMPTAATHLPPLADEEII